MANRLCLGLLPPAELVERLNQLTGLLKTDALVGRDCGAGELPGEAAGECRPVVGDLSRVTAVEAV